LSESRTKIFQRNEDLEKFLDELASNLWPSEARLIEDADAEAMKFPLVLIMGPLRSGTTLFMQWLANTGIFSYPTNLLSRFYCTPIIGAKIQRLLTDDRYNYRDELGEFLQKMEYASENGKTKGVLAPNEFWYFWRRFLAEPSRDVWRDDELRTSMDSRTMIAELNGIMSVFGRPFAAKGMLFNYNIPFFDTVFEKILFVQIKRDPLSNISSVLDARERQLGSREKWYSFEIPERLELVTLPPVEQAAGQVACINRAIDRGLSKVNESRKLVVTYEEFCHAPRKVFEMIASKLDALGYQVTRNYTGEDQFSAQTKSHLNIEESRKANELYSRFYG
jgi:hypothetical protein